MIDKNSVIHKKAKISETSEVGPYVVIGSNVEIGSNVKIYSHVNIAGNTKIGAGTKIYPFASIGTDPQDLKFKGEKTFLIIGDNNTIREFCTLNRGTVASGFTKIGNNCLFMAYVHVAHDCIIEDKVILANGVQLGGHSEIHYHATVGGITPIHQFCKVGKHSFIGGGRVVLQDVPPYILANGEPLQYSGLNSIGLRRRNFNLDTRNLIKKAYKILYLSNFNTSQAITKIKSELQKTNEIQSIINFIKKSDRGLI